MQGDKLIVYVQTYVGVIERYRRKFSILQEFVQFFYV